MDINSEARGPKRRQFRAKLVNPVVCDSTMRFANSAEAKIESEQRGRLLRVAIVAPRIEYLIGGQEVQADLLLRLWRDDSAAQISYLGTNLALPGWLERIPHLRTIVRFPIYLTRLWWSLRKADVAHIFSAASTSFLIATVPAFCVSRILGKKVLVHYHSGRARKHLSSSGIARNILRKADRVVVPSRYLLEVFGEFQVAAQAIPNLVDPALFPYRAREPLRPYLLCSRNFEPCYGIDLVLRAFAEVKKVFLGAQLLLLGEGSQENAIRRLIAELDLAGVEMPGRVTRENIGRFYDQADLMINASRVDNMPVSILEAFASGLAVVTTDAGGIPYIVRHEETGLVSKTEDWKQLAANVLRLLQDPALVQRLTDKAYRQSFTYRWTTIRAHWLGVYQELALPGDPRLHRGVKGDYDE
jgi:L-malate glycosyltransferase